MRRLGRQLRVRAASLILARVTPATPARPFRAAHPVGCRCDRILDGAMRPPRPKLDATWAILVAGVGEDP
ncbi:MAG TPA: hypothetical protein VIK38_02530 [Coriobacteriia bacterium]